MYKVLIQLQKKMLLCLAAGILTAVALGYGMGWMERFQTESAYREYQYNTGSYIAYFSGGLNQQDIDIISGDKRVSQCGIVTYYKKIAEGKGTDIWIRGANENYMLRNSTVLQGRLPAAGNELIAQQWVLEALGIPAESGQEVTFSLEDEEGRPSVETFVVSGVLENSAYAKESGDMDLFVPFDFERDRNPIINLDIDENADLLGSLQDINEKLAGTDIFYEFSSDAGAMRRQMITLTGKLTGKNIFLAVFLLFYFICIYQLSEEQFMRNTAKLRMCGYSIKQILSVYFQIIAGVWMVFVLSGLAVGRLCILFISRMAKLNQISFIFWGRKVSIEPEIFMPVFFCNILLSFAAVLLFFIWVIFRNAKRTVLEQLRFGERAERKSCRMKENGKRLLYFRIEWISIVLFVLAQVLFLSVSYQQHANKKMAENTAFSQCKNGDFQILGYQSENIANGVSREQLEAVRKIPGTVSVETASVLPVRVKIEDGQQVAENYYGLYNEYAKDTYYKAFLGEERISGDTVYKSSLMGYNDAALAKLSDYVIEGSIDIEEMRHSNAAVLFVPQYVEGEYRQRFYRNAEKVIPYQVGDRVTVKIRNQYGDGMEQYWAMEDQTGSHEEVFQVGAIVYYPYLPNTSAMGLVNPDIIISSDRMEQLTGQQICRVVAIQTADGINAEQYAGALNGDRKSVV